MESQPKTHQDMTSAYAFGFVLSILLTIIPYMLVVNGRLGGALLLIGLTIFAMAQLTIQLVFFLHLGGESRPRWKLLSFLFAAQAIVIIAIGSLWIMKNLNYNMKPHDMDNHIQHEERIYR